MRIHRPLEGEQAQEVIQRYLAGEGRMKIAQSIHTKPERITSTLQANQIPLRDEWKHKLPPEQERKMLERYLAGEAVKALAAEYGVSPGRIPHIVKRNQARVRGLGGQIRYWTEEELAQVRTWYQQGISQEEIAERLHTIQSLVSRLLRNHHPDLLKQPRRMLRKNGRIQSVDGYTLVLLHPEDKFHPMAAQSGYILEHRLVMAKHLDRILERHEQVHHINGIRTDNRIENLQLRQGAHGNGVQYVCLDCGSHNVKQVKLADMS